MNKIDIYAVINNIYNAFEYWTSLLKQYAGDTGIVVITGEDPEVDNIVLEMIPAFRTQKKYHDIIVVSDKETIITHARNTLGDHVFYLECSREWIVQFCHLQALMFPFNDIFITQSMIIDDANSFELAGYGGLDLWFVVSKVVFGLSDVPERMCNKKKRSESLSSAGMSFVSSVSETVNWKEYLKFICFDLDTYSSQEEFWDNRLNEMISNREIRSESRIVIYGNTSCALYYVEKLRHYDNVTVVDRNKEKHGRINNKVFVKSPEEVLTEYEEKTIILMTLIHYKEVCLWLFSLGYEMGKQIFIVNAPYNALNRSSEHIKAEVKQRITKGKEAYDKIREKYREETILLSPWNASGDIYIDCLYLSEFISEKGITKYQIVLSNPGAKKIATLFGFESELVSEEDAFAILDLARAVGFDQLNLININVNVTRQRIGNLCGNVDFNTLHQRLVFHSEIRKTIPDIHQDNSDAYFEYYHLQKGKTALLAPYTGTFGRIEEEVCLEIVNMLKDMGYSVCTNTGPGEEAIPGTTGVLIPYDCIIDFVNKCGLFIGMRSGLCDIISSTSAKMVVFHKESHFTFFSMKGMGIKTENILELKREDVSKYNVVETIKGFCDV